MEKKGFCEIFKNLARYRFKNNFVHHHQNNYVKLCHLSVNDNATQNFNNFNNQFECPI